MMSRFLVAAGLALAVSACAYVERETPRPASTATVVTPAAPAATVVTPAPVAGTAVMVR
jgi:hypothetical protein